LVLLYQHHQPRRGVRGSDARFAKAMRKCAALVASVLVFVPSRSVSDVRGHARIEAELAVRSVVPACGPGTAAVRTAPRSLLWRRSGRLDRLTGGWSRARPVVP
jgi:hypothetical protein